ncbi:unnamed protein product [Mortierella alpina]
MKARKILTKYSSRLFKEDKKRRDEISSRMKSLSDRDAGLAFWEDFCKENDWLPKPTNANIKRYIQEFVDVQKDKLHKTYRKLRLSKSDKGYRTSYVLFLEPVWRLHTKESSTPSTAEVPVMEASVPSALSSTSLNAHHDIVDIIQVSGSVVNGTTNLNENTNTNNLPAHAHDTTGNVAHPPEASGPVGMVLTVGDANDKYPLFKAQEFNNGLSRWSRYKEPPTGRYGLYDVQSVPDVLQEWRYGDPSSGQGEETSIQALNNRFSATWRSVADKTRYQARLAVVTEYIRLVLVEGCPNTEAIEILETKRRGRAIVTLANDLHKEAALRAEDTIYGKHEPRYPRHLIHLADHVPRPPSTELTRFPLPVRKIHSIPNIWHEWTIGWDDQPSIQSLINDMYRRGQRLWNHQDFKDYENHFRYRNQLVRTIREAKRKRVVPSHEDAIQVLEERRGAQEPSTLCKSQAFRRLLREEWRITTKVEEWWNYGPP